MKVIAVLEIDNEKLTKAGSCFENEMGRAEQSGIQMLEYHEHQEEYSGKNAAEIILQIMKEENINQTVLARKMGCARQNISQMLTRGTVNMRYDSLYKMANSLGYEIILRKNKNISYFVK